MGCEEEETLLANIAYFKFLSPPSPSYASIVGMLSISAKPQVVSDFKKLPSRNQTPNCERVQTEVQSEFAPRGTAKERCVPSLPVTELVHYRPVRSQLDP